MKDLGPNQPAAAMPVVAIIGGGFSGATVAWHLARALSAPAAILVIEPRPRLGEGLAYSTADPSHRINVPAARMTMDCAEEGGLQHWIETSGAGLSPGSRAANGALFPQRRLVADYVNANLQPYLATGRIRHLRARAIEVVRKAGFRIRLDDGGELAANRVVIATSHPPPGIPRALAALRDSPRLIADPSGQGRQLAAVAQSARQVLVVGTGLTSADVIASLDRQGFAGRILALSRRGLRSRGHAFDYPESTVDFAEKPARSALELLRRIREAVRRDSDAGLPWQAALDQVRRDGQAIWAALPQAERGKLLRWLRVWWDVHRFRIAPQVEEVLDRLIAQDRLRIVSGRLLAAHEAPGGIEVDWHARRVAPQSELFDAVILTTGPAHGDILQSSALLDAMARAGLIRPDPLGLGLEVTDHCRAVGGDGRPVPGLLVAGPLARGHVGELMGIPEVTAHAEAVAARLAESLPAAAPARRSDPA